MPYVVYFFHITFPYPNIYHFIFFVQSDFDNHLGVDVGASHHSAKLLKADLSVVVLQLIKRSKLR